MGRLLQCRSLLCCVLFPFRRQIRNRNPHNDIPHQAVKGPRQRNCAYVVICSMYGTPGLSVLLPRTTAVGKRGMQARRLSHAVLRRARGNSRSQSSSWFLCRSLTQSSSASGHAGSHGRPLSSSSRSKGRNPKASKFPPPSEAASVQFPGTDLRVSRVGFGSPWMGAAPDRGLDMSR